MSPARKAKTTRKKAGARKPVRKPVRKAAKATRKVAKKKTAKKAAKKVAKKATRKKATKAPARKKAAVKKKATRKVAKKVAKKVTKKVAAKKATAKKATKAPARKGTAKAAAPKPVAPTRKTPAASQPKVKGKGGRRRSRAKGPPASAPSPQHSIGGPAKPGLGTKWECFECEAKFYDLNRPVPLCPKCGADQRKRPKTKGTARAEKAAPAAARMEPSADEDAEEAEEPAEAEAGLDGDLMTPAGAALDRVEEED